ncbi:type VI secretion system Vgr family protein [uncultured Aquabacterium sp.]|uniref:type VI secretion system Vgr family protein n=1 Tax=uncultured Aquabacterium sp. TaxID=158753 RepID=UPI0025D2DDA2|nr:type VI secretion system Vgr family protein [uncultured Aquabacterium sp.]
MGMGTTRLPGAVASGALSGWAEGPGRLLGRLIAAWQTDTRLYTLTGVGAERPLPADLMVERFVLTEAVSEPFRLELHALVLDAHVELKQLYARPVTLHTTLADGRRTRRSGYVTEARSLDADGGLARKALVIQPWIALLGHTLHSRVWQDKSVIDIVEDVFADHRSVAAWHWDDGVAEHVAQGLCASQGGQRTYCVQYRESDLAFVQRLLAEEGIAWRVEEDDTAPGGHRLVFFVHSAAQPQDATSMADGGIRFHGSSSQEAQDSIQALGAWRALGPTATVVQGWDPQAHAAITAEVPTAHAWGGDEARSLQGWLASYDPTGDWLFSGSDEATFLATLLQQAHEARYKTWLGRGTVRTLRAGSWFALTHSTLDTLAAFGLADEDKQFFTTRVTALGINNLPKDLSEAVAQAIGASDLLDDGLDGLDGAPPLGEARTPAADTTALRERAAATGFACAFEALRRNVPWRPVLMDDTGLRPRPRPTALGPQTAIVVGPGGTVSPSGADELYTDVQGRIRVQFHWQANPFAPQRANTDHSCWLRVVQRAAGPGMGHQFIPRIGQEVLVGFLGNDIDRPVVIGALYNGQGESGIPPTPGGHTAQADTTALAQSTDHRPASQMNCVAAGAGGHSPAWHGAAPGSTSDGNEGQANAAALSGVKSKEFGGSGHNQLVFDDTPGQQRLALHTTQAQTWLQMGHLLHQADNHRGSLRGLGLELRTDAWGGLRAARGVMLSTYALPQAQGQSATPAGDNAPGMALAKQAQQLSQTFHQAATTHQTVGVATAAGSLGAGQSALNDRAAPAAALTQSLSGMVSTASLGEACGDAADQCTTPGTGKVPHMADPNIALIGKAGLGLTAGQDLHLSAQDTVQIASGQDTQVAVGGQARVHTGQAIGVLAGAVQPGSEAAGKGLTMIAAQGAVDMQAQAGAAQVAAKQTLELKTANGVVNIAAAKKVVLAVSGGASIIIEGGSFTAQCPGKITVKAGKKAMVGGGQQSATFPQMPKSICVECLKKSLAAAPVFTSVG